LVRRFFAVGTSCYVGDLSHVLARASSTVEDVSAAACAALSGHQDDRVHALALRLVARHPVTGHVLRLFRRNCGAGDELPIFEAVRRLAADGPRDEAHWAIAQTLRLAEGRPRSFRSFLEWAYVETPDSFCRMEIVELLSKHGLLSAELREESRLDSHPDTRALAAAEPRSRSPSIAT